MSSVASHREEVVVEIDVGVHAVGHVAEELCRRHVGIHERGVLVARVAVELIDEVFETHITRCADVDLAEEGNGEVGVVEQGGVHLVAEVVRREEIGGTHLLSASRGRHCRGQKRCGQFAGYMFHTKIDE